MTPKEEIQALKDQLAAANQSSDGMKNVNMNIDGDILTITVDLTKDFGLSKSGKSNAVASSSGNKRIPGTEAFIGLNIYKKAA